MSDNTLTGVDPDFLATAMSTTRKLNLANTGHTAVQVEKLLSLIAANCPMESLNLSANVLSMVEPELMAQAVNKLKDVTLIDTSLTVIKMSYFNLGVADPEEGLDVNLPFKLLHLLNQFFCAQYSP